MCATYMNTKQTQPIAAEPGMPYAHTRRRPHPSAPTGLVTPEEELMTVDEYFDELMELVRQDYAKLQG